MVVHWLESYVEQKIPEAFYSANLRELINQELSYGRPSIVLDESASQSLFLSEGILHIQWKPNLLKKKIENFVDKIISCGVNLTVVLRGNPSTNLFVWFNKRKFKFINQKKALLEVCGKGPKEDENVDNVLNSSTCIKITFASIKNSHYKVFQSVEDVHKEVAEIAISQNCLAVIGQDSNYMIYEGIRNYISIRSLDPETLDCKIYSRTKLIEHLGLKSYHLPLFATLCGNNVINYMNVVKFHKEIEQQQRDKFLGIAEMIKCYSDDPYKHIEDIFKLINHPKVNRGLIKQSIDMYLNFEKTRLPNKLLVFANKKKRAYDWSTWTYNIVTEREFRTGTVTGYPGCLPSTLLLRPLRRKIYGILLFKLEVPVAEYILEEMADLSNSKALSPVKVFPTMPVSKHPGLIQLFDDQTPNVYCLRWDLFCSSISGTLKQYIVKEIPPRLLLPVLALHYLAVEAPSNFSQKIFNENFEIEAFLVAALLVHENIQLESISNGTPDAKLTSLILYFHTTCFTLSVLNEACGLVLSKHQACFCNFFDGILLHSVYERMKGGAKWQEFFNDNCALKALFYSLMEIILP